MSSNEGNDGSNTPHPNANQATGMGTLLAHFNANKSELVLALTRTCTLVFTFMYILPIFGNINLYSCYQKALIANAATSALRLHNRLPPFRLNRDYIQLMLLEDSLHYLIFSLIFLFNSSVTLVLLPIALFAFLHLASSLLSYMDKLGNRNSTFGTFLSNSIQKYQQSILQTVALTEIILMPVVVFSLFAGRASLITPFIYYRFLSLRYASRRNPYTRQVFHDLRMTGEAVAYRPGTPLFLRNFIMKIIAFVSRLSPPLASN